VTLEQVLLHTSGFPTQSWISRPSATAARVEQMESWPLEWEPGTKFEYHAMSAHWVLGELITLLTGLDHRDAVRRRVLDPLGMDRFQLGVPIGQQGDIERLVEAGEPPTRAEVAEVLGFELDLPPMNTTLDMFEGPAVRVAGVPGGGGVSGAASLAEFYLALLDDRHGLWDRRSSTTSTNVRNRMPNVLGFLAMRTLGLEIAGDDPAPVPGRRGATHPPRSATVVRQARSPGPTHDRPGVRVPQQRDRPQLPA
jgi:CubicO group peptidase (beta-lactamase class C family)